MKKMNIQGTRNLIFGLLLIVVVLVVFLISSMVYVVNQSRSIARQDRAYISCVLNWATESTHRTAELTGAATTRQNALDRVLRDVAADQANPPKDVKAAQEQFRHDIEAYVKASDAYNKTLKQHPVPKSPKLACANVKK
jgi:apolipoprotein N-acyltransferase